MTAQTISNDKVAMDVDGNEIVDDNSKLSFDDYLSLLKVDENDLQKIRNSWEFASIACFLYATCCQLEIPDYFDTFRLELAFLCPYAAEHLETLLRHITRKPKSSLFSIVKAVCSSFYSSRAVAKRLESKIFEILGSDNPFTAEPVIESFYDLSVIHRVWLVYCICLKYLEFLDNPPEISRHPRLLPLKQFSLIHFDFNLPHVRMLKQCPDSVEVEFICSTFDQLSAFIRECNRNAGKVKDTNGKRVTLISIATKLGISKKSTKLSEQICECIVQELMDKKKEVDIEKKDLELRRSTGNSVLLCYCDDDDDDDDDVSKNRSECVDTNQISMVCTERLDASQLADGEAIEFDKVQAVVEQSGSPGKGGRKTRRSKAKAQERMRSMMIDNDSDDESGSKFSLDDDSDEAMEEMLNASTIRHHVRTSRARISNSNWPVIHENGSTNLTSNMRYSTDSAISGTFTGFKRGPIRPRKADRSQYSSGDPFKNTNESLRMPGDFSALPANQLPLRSDNNGMRALVQPLKRGPGRPRKTDDLVGSTFSSSKGGKSDDMPVKRKCVKRRLSETKGGNQNRRYGRKMMKMSSGKRTNNPTKLGELFNVDPFVSGTDSCHSSDVNCDMYNHTLSAGLLASLEQYFLNKYPDTDQKSVTAQDYEKQKQRLNCVSSAGNELLRGDDESNVSNLVPSNDRDGCSEIGGDRAASSNRSENDNGADDGDQIIYNRRNGDNDSVDKMVSVIQNDPENKIVSSIRTVSEDRIVSSIRNGSKDKIVSSIRQHSEYKKASVVRNDSKDRPVSVIQNDSEDRLVFSRQSGSSDDIDCNGRNDGNMVSGYLIESEAKKQTSCWNMDKTEDAVQIGLPVNSLNHSNSIEAVSKFRFQKYEHGLGVFSSSRNRRDDIGPNNNVATGKTGITETHCDSDDVSICQFTSDDSFSDQSDHVVEGNVTIRDWCADNPRRPRSISIQNQTYSICYDDDDDDNNNDHVACPLQDEADVVHPEPSTGQTCVLPETVCDSSAMRRSTFTRNFNIFESISANSLDDNDDRNNVDDNNSFETEDTVRERIELPLYGQDSAVHNLSKYSTNMYSCSTAATLPESLLQVCASDESKGTNKISNGSDFSQKPALKRNPFVIDQASDLDDVQAEGHLRSCLGRHVNDDTAALSCSSNISKIGVSSSAKSLLDNGKEEVEHSDWVEEASCSADAQQQYTLADKASNEPTELTPNQHRRRPIIEGTSSLNNAINSCQKSSNKTASRCSRWVMKNNKKKKMKKKKTSKQSTASDEEHEWTLCDQQRQTATGKSGPVTLKRLTASLNSSAHSGGTSNIIENSRQEKMKILSRTMFKGPRKPFNDPRIVSASLRSAIEQYLPSGEALDEFFASLW